MQAVVSTSDALELPDFLTLYFAPPLGAAAAPAPRAAAGECSASAADLLRTLVGAGRYAEAARSLARSINTWAEGVRGNARQPGAAPPALWLPCKAVSRLLHGLSAQGSDSEFVLLTDALQRIGTLESGWSAARAQP